MSLNVTTLETGLRSFMAGPNFPSNATDAATRWAAAYKTYASAATSPMGGGPAPLTGAEAVLKAALLALFVPSSSGAATMAGMGAAFTTFWLSPPVVFGGGPPGAVIAVGGTAALASGLASTGAAVQSGKMSGAQAATLFAAVFHTFTQTVIVMHPVVPTPVIGPIS